MSEAYDKKFYEHRHNNSLYSAETMMEIVHDLVNPKTVVDVGCGVGTWLKVMKDRGIKSYLGIEGEWVSENEIVIPQENFLKADLTKPLKINKKFDLAISLEVAEHIDEKHANQYLENLTSLAPVILFSAAIPHQGGSNHVNERWPYYWKNKFEKFGYVIIDCVRNKVWEDEYIEMWYAQNSFIYVKEELLDNYPKLKREYEESPKLLSVVHPRFYQHKIKTLPILKAIINKWNRSFGKKKKN